MVALTLRSLASGDLGLLITRSAIIRYTPKEVYPKAKSTVENYALSWVGVNVRLKLLERAVLQLGLDNGGLRRGEYVIY